MHLICFISMNPRWTRQPISIRVKMSKAHAFVVRKGCSEVNGRFRSGLVSRVYLFFSVVALKRWEAKPLQFWSDRNYHRLTFMVLWCAPGADVFNSWVLVAIAEGNVWFSGVDSDGWAASVVLRVEINELVSPSASNGVLCNDSVDFERLAVSLSPDWSKGLK